LPTDKQKLVFFQKIYFWQGIFMPSVLWRCWLGGRKGIWPVKTEWWGAGMVVCQERGADLHTAQLMPLPLTVSCFSKIQTGFTFLVPAHLGSPRQRAVKRLCVCARTLFQWKTLFSTQWEKKLAKRLISGYHSILLMSVAVRVTTGQYGHIKNQTKNQQWTYQHLSECLWYVWGCLRHS